MIWLEISADIRAVFGYHEIHECTLICPYAHTVHLKYLKVHYATETPKIWIRNYPNQADIRASFIDKITK